MIKKVIDTKGDYELVLGSSTEDGNLCYLLVNLETGVIEVETRILPQAYKYLEDLSAGLDAMKALREEDKNPTETVETVDNVSRIH